MSLNSKTRILAVASGKGGVGKTNISVNLGLALAEEGYRTVLFDADLGLANINILLAIDPEFTLESVISGDKDLSEIIVRDYNGIDIIPGSSGVEKVANLEKEAAEQLSRALSKLDTYDYLIFDTSAGIANHVVAFCMASSEVLLVITPEPTSMTDAYALLKVLYQNNYDGEVKIIINQCKDKDQAMKEYSRFYGAVKKFLNKKVSPAGIIVTSSKVVESVKEQKPFYLKYPESNPSRCIKFIAKNLISKKPSEDLYRDMQAFWKNCFNYMKGNLLINDANSNNDEKDDIFNFQEENNKALSAEKKNEKTGNGLEVIQPDKLFDLMQTLIKSVDRVSEEIREINSRLKSGSSILAGSGPNKIISSVSNNSSGFSLDYDEYVQERVNVLSEKNG